jgi:hypothetical protein
MTPARSLAAVVALALLAILPFLPGTRGGFFEDDFPIIYHNPALRDGRALWRVFGQDYWHERGRGGLYRPLTVLSYGIDRLIWGAEPTVGAPDPRGMHRTNLALHAAVSLLLLAILHRRMDSRTRAWLGAALFAVHPVHTEAIVHLVGRAELLMALLFLAGFHLHGRSGPARWLAPVCYLGAMLSKESGVMLPAVLVIDAWLRSAPGQIGVWRSWRAQARALWPHAVALACYLTVRGLVLGATLSPPRRFALHVPGQYLAFPDPASGEIPLTMLHALGEYLLLLVAPVWLSADYSGFPHHVTLARPVLLSGLALAGLLGAAWWSYRRGVREPACWLAWFLLTLLPVSNLLAVSGVVMAERLLYLPSVAVCALAGWGLGALGARHPVLAAAPGGAALAVLAMLSRDRAPLWNDPVALLEETVRRGRYHGHIALTGVAGEYARMIQEDPAREAELLKPALDAARRSVAASPNTLNLRYLAILAGRAGHRGEALESWEHLRRTEPRNASYHDAVASAVRELLAHPARLDDLTKALEIGTVSLRVGERFHDWDGMGFWLDNLAAVFEVWIAHPDLGGSGAPGHVEIGVQAARRALDVSTRSDDATRIARWRRNLERLERLRLTGGG